MSTLAKGGRGMFIEEQIKELKEQIEDLSNEVTYLKAKSSEQILTPEEFSELTKINRNTVYCWIREGRIQVLPNLGMAKRIPMSQFYETSEKLKNKKNKVDKKVDELKREFIAMQNI